MQTPDPTEKCPIDCPNRKPQQQQQGKVAAYAFSLIVTLFLSSQAVSYERREKELPMTVWMPALVLIGLGLGVQIDSSTIGGWIKK